MNMKGGKKTVPSSISNIWSLSEKNLRIKRNKQQNNSSNEINQVQKHPAEAGCTLSVHVQLCGGIFSRTLYRYKSRLKD